MDYDRYMRAYLRMRARKSELTKAYDAEMAILKRDMTTLETAMLGGLIQNKVKNMATEVGTVFTEEVLQVNVEDWPAYHACLIAENDLSGMQKRVSVDFVRAYMEAHDGKPPPGINATKEKVVRIRVANSSGA